MLHIRERRKNDLGGHPVGRMHGEAVILPLPDSKLFGRVVEGIEGVTGTRNIFCIYLRHFSVNIAFFVLFCNIFGIWCYAVFQLLLAWTACLMLSLRRSKKLEIFRQWKGRSLRKKPIRGAFRLQSQVFQNFSSSEKPHTACHSE